MLMKVFLLGRPGSGKSAAARSIIKQAQQQGWLTTYINDYDILYRWFVHEQHLPESERRYFKPTERGGFDVADFSVLRLALEEVQKRVQKHMDPLKRKLVLIEFARGDYREVLYAFGPEFLHDAYFLYFDADIDACIERVRERSLHPCKRSDHFVSEWIMKTYYGKENKPYILGHLARDYQLDEQRVVVIDNTGTLESFLDEMKGFSALLFGQNPSRPRQTTPASEAVSQQEPVPRRKTGPLALPLPSLGQSTECLGYKRLRSATSIDDKIS